MTIAIDFDGTYAALPELRAFGALLVRAGHTVVIVTGRSDHGEFGAEVRRGVAGALPIVFAGEEWKRHAAARAGYKVNIWIDDNPEYIGPQNLIGAFRP